MALLTEAEFSTRSPESTRSLYASAMCWAIYPKAEIEPILLRRSASQRAPCMCMQRIYTKSLEYMGSKSSLLSSKIMSREAVEVIVRSAGI